MHFTAGNCNCRHSKHGCHLSKEKTIAGKQFEEIYVEFEDVSHSWSTTLRHIYRVFFRRIYSRDYKLCRRKLHTNTKISAAVRTRKRNSNHVTGMHIF